MNKASVNSVNDTIHSQATHAFFIINEYKCNLATPKCFLDHMHLDVVYS